MNGVHLYWVSLSCDHDLLVAASTASGAEIAAQAAIKSGTHPSSTRVQSVERYDLTAEDEPRVVAVVNGWE